MSSSTRLDHAIRSAEGLLYVGGRESEMDPGDVRDRGLAKLDRAEQQLEVLLPLAALLDDHPTAAAGLEHRAAAAAARSEDGAREQAALDRLIADHPEAQAGVDALLRYVRGRR